MYIRSALVAVAALTLVALPSHAAAMQPLPGYKTTMEVRTIPLPPLSNCAQNDF